MNSDQTHFNDLNTVVPNEVYLLPRDFPTDTLDDHVKTIHFTRYYKPTGEEVADRIIQLAQAAMNLSSEVETKDPNQQFYDPDIINKLREMEPEVLEVLALDKDWVREHLRTQYLVYLNQRGYVAGEQYLLVEVAQIDLTPEGLNIQNNVRAELRRYSQEQPPFVEDNRYLQFSIELRLNPQTTPCYDQQVLEERIVNEQLSASRDFKLLIDECDDYPTEALLWLLPKVYSHLRKQTVPDRSELELSAEVFTFFDEDIIMTHPDYESYVAERKKTTNRKPIEVAAAKGLTLVPPAE